MSLVSLNNSETDKHTTHSYLELYDTILCEKKETATDVLEIGVQFGGSIKLWYDFFTNATIYGLDILDRNRIEEIKNNQRVKLIVQNAYSIDIINQYLEGKKFDFIIDDGPHTLDSMISCIQLYSPLLKEDGILIIEDVQSIDWFERLRNSTPEELKQYIETYDRRSIKNRYDDLVFVINKSKKI